jgi:uncharacterized protein YbjT (DUF2867 family)
VRVVVTGATGLIGGALVRELQALRREARRSQWEEASRDPLFLKYIAEVTAAFQSADTESARSMD